MAFVRDLEESDRMIKAIDHLLYVTYPLVRDKRMLLKIMIETKKTIVSCINTILKYEYVNKSIELSRDSKSNLKLFFEKCAPKYEISKIEMKLALDLFELAEMHRQSQMEFLKDNKVVILSQNMSEKYLTIDKSKEFLNLAKNILQKTKDHLSEI